VTAPPTDPDEYSWQLIARTRDGDADAFGEFYDHHVTSVYGHIFGQVRDRRTA